MTMKKLVRTGIVAGAVCAAAVLLAAPASAAQVDDYFHGTHAAVDLHPGNGAPGWVWVYGSTELRTVSGSIEYELRDGGVHELTVRPGKAASANTPENIIGFRACRTSYVDSFEFKACADWKYFE